MRRPSVDGVADAVPQRCVYWHIKRLLDLVGALLLLLLLSPGLAWASLRLRAKGLPILAATPQAGMHCRPFVRYRFTSSGKTRDWPVLFNILKGDLSFIGPRAAAPGEFCVDCHASLRSADEGVETEPASRRDAARVRATVRPGLISDWWIRQRANMAYDDELLCDAEYVHRLSLLHDMQILLKSLPALLGGLFSRERRSAGFQDEVVIQGIRIDNVTMHDAIERIMEFITTGGDIRQVCFINAQYANAAYENPAYRAVLERADLVLADGIGMRMAGKILGREIRENVNGTDLFPRLCRRLEPFGRSVYLLGAQPGVVDEVVNWIRTNYPGVVVKGARHGYFTEAEEGRVVSEIAACGADVLLAAMGCPMQELWIDRHREALGVKVAMGVGGLFDFYSGRVRRAPLWMREIGLEWMYRLLQEPGRMWRRYVLGNNVFLYHTLRERFSKGFRKKTDEGRM